MKNNPSLQQIKITKKNEMKNILQRMWCPTRPAAGHLQTIQKQDNWKWDSNNNGFSKFKPYITWGARRNEQHIYPPTRFGIDPDVRILFMLSSINNNAFMCWWENQQSVSSQSSGTKHCFHLHVFQYPSRRTNHTKCWVIDQITFSPCILHQNRLI